MFDRAASLAFSRVSIYLFSKPLELPPHRPSRLAAYFRKFTVPYCSALRAKLNRFVDETQMHATGEKPCWQSDAIVATARSLYLFGERTMIFTGCVFGRLKTAVQAPK